MAFEPPGGRGAAYAGAEAVVVRRIRRYLLDTVALDPENVVIRAYWKTGATNHPDGDYATD